MDLQSILALLGLSSAGGKVAWVIGIITAIYKWYNVNKDKIQAIVLRIEKERIDGWTHDEKEQLVIDTFFQEVYPKLPVWVRMIPFRKSLIENIIRKIVKSICKKSSAVKEIVATEIVATEIAKP